MQCFGALGYIGLMDGWRGVVRRHGWWLLLTTVVTVVVTVAVGFWLLPIYATVNAGGAMLYLDGIRGRPARIRRLVVPALAIALMPVGLLFLTRPNKGLAPSEIATSASPSDDHRRGTAGVQMGATLGPGGRTGT